jgi:hypothetical protein
MMLLSQSAKAHDVYILEGSGVNAVFVASTRSKGPRPLSKSSNAVFCSAVTEVGHAFSSGSIRRFLQEHRSLTCRSMLSCSF